MRYPVPSFLDEYNGYQLIFTDPEDAIKTTFTIGDAIYYYVYIPFDLKNVRASF